MKSLKVGLLGIGTVGGGTYTVLKRNHEEISLRAGRKIEIVKIAERNVQHAKELTNGQIEVTNDLFSVVTDPNIDVVVELIVEKYTWPTLFSQPAWVRPIPAKENPTQAVTRFLFAAWGYNRAV